MDGVWELLTGPGGPLWLDLAAPLLTAGLGAFAGYRFGHDKGVDEEKAQVADRVEQEVLRRRNDLWDRGRTTERRPEHDGQPPSANRHVRIVGPRPPADRPRRPL